MSPPDANITLLARAYAFAAVQHAGQHRNAASGEPYLNHLAEVANLLAYATEGNNAALVAAGVLHDVLEDTGTTPDELRALFGPAVADIVEEVTDPADLSEVDRRRHQVDHAHELSAPAKLLKIADKTSNIRERLAHRPEGQSDEQIRDYIEWGEMVVAGCRGLNEKLEDAFNEAYEAGLRKYAG
ncbi:MAG: (p)ppGpp synthase/HD superfamily hydrolase [Alphaproteobacteria bacterium]|jgi:(p)ppGpp synthase/HD superfamily hydrolase